jgi:very-short-patch-repair endonuclease
VENCKICKKEIKNRGALVVHEKTCEKILLIKDNIVNDYIRNEMSVTRLCRKYNLGSNIINDIIGDKKRTLVEANRIGKKLFPFKHNDSSKAILRYKRLKYMEENPEKTAWRCSNISYPEKLFLEKIKNSGLDKKYLIIREYSVFPYFIDFAFLNEKIAVEIDGSQHLLPDRKNSDMVKDKVLNENGWKVVRVTENEVKTNIDNLFLEILDILGKNDVEIKNTKIGVFKHKKSDKVKSNKSGLTDKEIGRVLNQRKVVRPEYSVLIEDIKNLGYLGTGRKYSVSDNSIRKWVKWCEKYNIN